MRKRADTKEFEATVMSHRRLLTLSMLGCMCVDAGSRYRERERERERETDRQTDKQRKEKKDCDGKRSRLNYPL